ncbi:MAG TPA: response regulator [Vicinamibacterales bacterium]|nr:response regulator [Vicinamibacterales bacterium]
MTWRRSVAVTEKPAREAARSPVILVVTSDAGLREASARAIGGQGFTVVTAAHAGHAVLACLKAGQVDLLITELSMDDVSGPALAARLRRHCPKMETVYFANTGTPECRGVLVRPFTRDDLLSALAVTRVAAAG